MKVQKSKRNAFFAMLVATFLFGTISGMAQRRIPVEEIALPIKGNCPNPIAITLNATSPNVVNADFTPAMLAAPRSFLNDPAPNKSFLYTFQWKRPQRCCEITRAVLTVKMKSNQPGQSKTSADAGNDGFALMHLGAAIPGYSGLYTSWPFNVGQPVTKTLNLTGAALSYLNSHGTVSIYVQDDTMVLSASLQISGCCLTTPKPGVAEESNNQQ